MDVTRIRRGRWLELLPDCSIPRPMALSSRGLTARTWPRAGQPVRRSPGYPSHPHRTTRGRGPERAPAHLPTTIQADRKATGGAGHHARLFAFPGLIPYDDLQVDSIAISSRRERYRRESRGGVTTIAHNNDTALADPELLPDCLSFRRNFPSPIIKNISACIRAAAKSVWSGRIIASRNSTAITVDGPYEYPPVFPPSRSRSRASHARS